MRFYLLALPLLLASLLAGPAVAGELLAVGDDFPEMSLPAPAEADARAYLGLPEGSSFTASQVKAELLLVEILNTHCPHCQMQAASYNALYDLIEANPATRGRIKLFGIAVGNVPGEVQIFTGLYSVPFPVLADPRFAAHRAIGGSATPFSIYVRLQGPGKPGVVAGTHLGLNTHYESLYAELQRLAAADPAELRRQGASAARVRQAIAPLFSEKELEYRVRSALIAAGGFISDFAPVELGSGRRVYTALVRKEGGQRRLFAEVTSRLSVCDICHDVHFIYVFDAAGRVTGFEPLQLTKYGNVAWSAGDIEKMRRRVVGRYLTMPHAFDPQVDAVTSATITSAI